MRAHLEVHGPRRLLQRLPDALGLDEAPPPPRAQGADAPPGPTLAVDLVKPSARSGTHALISLPLGEASATLRRLEVLAERLPLRSIPLHRKRARMTAETLPRPALSPQMTAQQALALLLDGQRHALSDALAAVTADAAERPVHRARVALRRIKATLALFRPLVATREEQALRSVLQPVMDALAAVRDLDVLRAGVLADIAAAAPRLGAAPALLQDLDRAVAAGHDKARQHLLAVLADSTTASLFWRLDILIQQARAVPRRDSQPLAPFAARRLKKRWKKLAAERESLASADPADWHRLRLTVKKLRFAASSFAPLLPAREAKRLSRRSTQAQDALGALNDAVLAPQEVRALDADATATALVTGWCAALVAPRHAAAERAVAKLCKEFGR